MGVVRVLAGVGAAVLTTSCAGAADPPGVPPGFAFPGVPAGRPHARALLANALRYADPAHKPTDPASGYPFEGWNHDPKQGVYLRAFTQLTAIGLWLELLAAVAAGQAEVPFLTPDQALADLSKVVKTLLKDQQDPGLAAKGLLVNFLDLETGRRRGPLAADVDRRQFAEALGRDKGEAIWQALASKGWIVPRGPGDEAEIRRRRGEYGDDCFDGVLKPYCDPATKKAVMAILDRRAVTVVFGDNANLSASAAKAAGALLHPAVKDKPGAAEVRADLDRFLDAQRDGYARLYDPAAGLFFFGWDAGRDRLFGWVNLEGKWVTGHLDYLVNEFRGPAAFVVARFGLPAAAVGNLGFQVKPYRLRAGREVFTLAPWEGSAFQVFGLQGFPNELASPGWRALLAAAVEVQVDYSSRYNLPGFLSESYTGNGLQYTGAVGIPEITVSPQPRVTDAPSLYTLGPAYTVAPDKVEGFLAANWPAVAGLLTDHGPWEGYNATRREPVRFQTTAHTLSLALGLLATGPDHLAAYLDAKGLRGRLDELTAPGAGADLLAADTQVFAWTSKGATVRSERTPAGFRVTGDRAGPVGVAFVPAGAAGVNLSGGVLRVRYKSAGPDRQAVVDLKPAGVPADAGLIPKQVFARLAATGGREDEIAVPLPETPGLARVKEVVLTAGTGPEVGAVDLTVTGLRVTPAGKQ